MEEKMNEKWERLTSSELTIRGGASIDWLVKIAGLVTAVLAFIRDYIPSFVNGFKKGKK